jgi:hypothetical protein
MRLRRSQGNKRSDGNESSTKRNNRDFFEAGEAMAEFYALINTRHFAITWGASLLAAFIAGFLVGRLF